MIEMCGGLVTKRRGGEDEEGTRKTACAVEQLKDARYKGCARHKGCQAEERVLCPVFHTEGRMDLGMVGGWVACLNVFGGDDGWGRVGCTDGVCVL